MDEHTEACLRAMLDKKQMQVRPNNDANAWIDGAVRDVLACLAVAPECVRIKPQVMCSLGGIEYPMPMQEAPEVFSDVWMVSLSGENGAYELEWTGGEDCMRWLAANVLHATKEAAEAHSKALLAVNDQAVKAAKEQA